MSSIAAVAKSAGVSSATVSRVMNESTAVSEGTARAVRDAMKRLRYEPSERRPGPKPGSRRAVAAKQTVAFLVFASAGRQGPRVGFEQLLQGVSDALAERGAELALRFVSDPSAVPTFPQGSQPQGLLLHGDEPAGGLPPALAKLPKVWLMANRRRPSSGDQVMPSAERIGEAASAYLKEQGHERVAYLNLNPGHWGHQLHRDAFTLACARAGLAMIAIESPVRGDTAYWADAEPEAAEHLLDTLLAADPRPTGLFVADDFQAATLQPALLRRGVGLGQGGDFQIVSCNHEQPYLAGLDPRPATIDIRTRDVAACGVATLMMRLANSDLPERLSTSIDPELKLP